MPSAGPKGVVIDWPLAVVIMTIIVCMTALAALKVIDSAVLTHFIVGTVALLFPSPLNRGGVSPQMQSVSVPAQARLPRDLDPPRT
jgi:hypothetical protein